MAYGIPEYPSTGLYDSDLTEILRLYRKLVCEYDDFLNRLTKIEGRLTELEDHIDEVLEEKLKDVRADMAKLKEEMEQIQRELTAEVNQALADIRELKRLTEIEIAELKEYVDKTVADSKAYVDKEILELRANVNKKINDLQIQVDKEIADLKVYVRDYVQREIKRFDAVLDELNRKIVDLKSYVDIGDNRVRAELYKAIEELEQKIVDITVDQVWVKSPIDGDIINIQEAIDQIWDHVDWWSLTAAEYDGLMLTAEEYDSWDTMDMGGVEVGIKALTYDQWRLGALTYDDFGLTVNAYDYASRTYMADKGLTAEEYDFLAKWYLLEKGSIVRFCWKIRDEVMNICKKCKEEVEVRLSNMRNLIEDRTTMFNAFTGMKDSVVHVVEQMYQFLSYGALTAEQYDTLDLTADEYDSKDVTAYEYDWYGIRSLLPPGESLGIKATQYDNLSIMPDGHVVYVN